MKKKKTRKPLSSRIRFEVFKRDSFTCQYCGQQAPDIVLHVDHIKPVSKGGTNSTLNLITSCRDCNGGKSNKEISDDTVINKQMQQLEDLQHKREQMEMMFRWQKSLMNIEDDMLKKVCNFWNNLTRGWYLNENGTSTVRKILKKHGLSAIMEAMRISAETYLKTGEDGKITNESWNQAFSRIGGICTNKEREKDDPEEGRLYYVRGIIRKRFSYCDESTAIMLLKKAYDAGVRVTTLEKHAKQSRNWSLWKRDVECFIQEANHE